MSLWVAIICILQLATEGFLFLLICVRTYIYGCDVQQFLTAIEKMDLSNNVITDDSTGIEVSCLVLNLPVCCNFMMCVVVHVHYYLPPPLNPLPPFLPSLLSPPLTAWQYIDSVTYLHLGFNQLKSVPRFGPRAKFNLTGLNLRNNQLSTLEGERSVSVTHVQCMCLCMWLYMYTYMYQGCSCVNWQALELL